MIIHPSTDVYMASPRTQLPYLHLRLRNLLILTFQTSLKLSSRRRHQADLTEKEVSSQTHLT